MTTTHIPESPHLPVSADSSTSQGWVVPGVTGKSGEQRRISASVCIALDALDAAVAEVANQLEDLDTVSSQAVAERLVVTVRKLQAVHRTCVGRVAKNKEWTSDREHRSPTAWIRDTQHESPSAAKALQADTEWLGHNSIFARLFQQGLIPVAHVSIARRHISGRPWRQQAFYEVEKHFAEVAQRVHAQRFERVVRTWAENVDDVVLSDVSHEQDAQALQHKARRASLHQVGDMWELVATLPAIDGALLAGVLNQIMEEDRRATCTCGRASCTCDSDGRTVQQRRADALSTLTAHAAHAQHISPTSSSSDAEETPASQTAKSSAVNLAPPVGNIDRTKVLLIIPINQLVSPFEHNPDQWNFRGYVGHALDVKIRSMAAEWMVSNGPGSGHLNRTSALTELCDTVVQRIVTGPDSEPLDVGRKTRIVPAAMRNALMARDRGCIFDGCDIPAGWCHAHHIQHWAHGGPTSLRNLALLCAKHHTAVHNHQYTIAIGGNGQPQICRSIE